MLLVVFIYISLARGTPVMDQGPMGLGAVQIRKTVFTLVCMTYRTWQEERTGGEGRRVEVTK